MNDEFTGRQKPTERRIHCGLGTRLRRELISTLACNLALDDRSSEGGDCPQVPRPGPSHVCDAGTDTVTQLATFVQISDLVEPSIQFIRI